MFHVSWKIRLRCGKTIHGFILSTMVSEVCLIQQFWNLRSSNMAIEDPLWTEIDSWENHL